MLAIATTIACGQGGKGEKQAAARADAAVALTPVDAAPAPKAEARVEHAVWNLVDNRLMAHRVVAGDLAVDASDSGVARYHRFGLPTPRWKRGVVIDGVPASVSASVPGIEVPLTAEQARATRVVARVHVPEPRKLTLKINGRKVARTALAAGWQTVELAVGARRFQLGENLIALEVDKKSALGLAWLRITDAVGLRGDPRASARFEPDADRIVLHGGAGLAWYVVVPDGANLVATVFDAVAAPPSPDCRVDVVARTSDGSFVGGKLVGADARVDLSSLAGRAVRLELVARDCQHAMVAGARVTINGEAPELPAPGPPPRYIVLWVMDALRADRIRVFHPGARPETPAFDELAQSGVVFRQFYVQGNESQTSHSSVWTALYPAVHGVRMAGRGGRYRIERRFDTLGELMRARGLHTTAVTGNGFVNKSGGYARGFDQYRNMMQELGKTNYYIPGSRIVDAALGQLDALRAEPTFLFLGTIDTHGPYVARKPWIDRYDPGPYDGPFQRGGTAFELGIIPGQMGCHKVPAPRDVQRLRAIYDSAVSYQDWQLGRFVAKLKAWGIYDQTMIVITADHGEEMFEENRCGHGASLRESLVHVPLLVRYPARFRPNTIIEEGAEGVDVLPTLLDALGAPPIAAAQGETLRPLGHGVGQGWARPSYASQYEYAHTMRLGRYKIRVGRTGIPIIADLVDDPEEHLDYHLARPVERRMLTDHLGLFLALRTRWSKATWGVVSNMSKGAAQAIDPPLGATAPGTGAASGGL